MNSVKILCRNLVNAKYNENILIRNFSLSLNLRKNVPYDMKYDEEGSALWFTNLPGKRRRGLSLQNEKKFKKNNRPMPSGPLVIDCKNSKLNHYRGMHYKKFDVVPLASKGWHHRKSAGDYFTILQMSEHPAFLYKSDEKIVLSFEEMGVSENVIKRLKDMNINFPTVIQAKTIPEILNGKNVLITAETGSGKTLSYLVPMVENILKWKQFVPTTSNSPFGIIIFPTRELAIQAGNVVKKLCSNIGIEHLTVLGGHSKELLLNPVVQPVDILVCTLGVLVKFMYHNFYSMNLCRQVVVDEADTLLDDSFYESLRKFIIKSKLAFADHQNSNTFPKFSQLCLASATMPDNVESLLEPFIPIDTLSRISTSYLHKIQPHIPQIFKRVKKCEKAEVLLQTIKRNIKFKLPTIIFSNKTSTCNWLNLFLNENGVKSIRINGKMNFEDRLKQYQQFRDGLVDVISTTDILSRGLDCTRAKNVINYEFPRFMADYVHRCGRTGRIGHEKDCCVINLISKKGELPLVHSVEKAARTESKLENVNNNITKILRRRFLNSTSISD